MQISSSYESSELNCSFSLLAPSEPPQSVSIAEITSASVTLMWDAPETEQQNGIITGYVINVTMVETGERFQSFSTSSTLILDALRPFTSYICAIAAQTIAGVGPFSTTVSVRTEEGGRLTLYAHRYQN